MCVCVCVCVCVISGVIYVIKYVNGNTIPSGTSIIDMYDKGLPNFNKRRLLVKSVNNIGSDTLPSS